MVTCSQCKNQNPPELDLCQDCGADLLPPPGRLRRAWWVIRAILIGLFVMAAGLVPLILWLEETTMVAFDSLFLLIALVGVVILLSGLIRSLLPSTIYARYLDRAARHASIDPAQAADDFVHGVMLAPVKIRPSLTQKLPKKLKAVIAASEYARVTHPGGYQSPEGIRKIIYSAYTTWAGLSESIPQFGQAASIGRAAGVARATSNQKRKAVLAFLANLFHELAADGLVRQLGWCRRCKAVVTCDDAGHCSCDQKHGAARGIIFVPLGEADLFTRRLQQAFAGP
jgi:hypothetical protein